MMRGINAENNIFIHLTIISDIGDRTYIWNVVVHLCRYPPDIQVRLLATVLSSLGRVLIIGIQIFNGFGADRGCTRCCSHRVLPKNNQVEQGLCGNYKIIVYREPQKQIEGIIAAEVPCSTLVRVIPGLVPFAAHDNFQLVVGCPPEAREHGLSIGRATILAIDRIFPVAIMLGIFKCQACGERIVNQWNVQNALDVLATEIT